MLSNAVPKPVSRLEEKQAKRTSEAKEMRECYRKVDEREAYRCRVTRVNVDPSAVSMLARGHHHHMVYRSRGGGHHTNNVVLVSPKVHLAIHAGEIRLTGDADVVNGILLERWTDGADWKPERWI